MTKAVTKAVNITVVIDGAGDECLYCEGKAWEHKGEITVYVCDLVEAADGRPILLQHVEIELVHDEWPDSLEDAVKEPVTN